MEFFVPGLLFFIITVLFTFYIAPKATPMIAAILSLVFLTYGVYDHYLMFASEYRSSTWQEPLLLMYSPAVMITVLILYVLYGMSALFSKGQVPVPAMPTMPTMPTMPSVNNTLNQVTESLSQAINNVINNNQDNNQDNNNTNRGNRNNSSNMSRSFVEAV